MKGAGQNLIVIPPGGLAASRDTGTVVRKWNSPVDIMESGVRQPYGRKLRKLLSCGARRLRHESKSGVPGQPGTPDLLAL